jgi:anhydro-N-acetylmuramic acid kinase
VAGDPEPILAVGLMSGTSLDGISAALVRIAEPAPEDFRVELVAHRVVGYAKDRRDGIAAAIARGGARELAVLHYDLGSWFADAAAELLRESGVGPREVAFVASHGQTIWHEPRRATLQLGCAAVIAERLGVDVVSDFRARDVAAGGEGAPLVPRVDRLLFSRPDGPRVLLNIGGIANLSLVPARGDDAAVIAFDTGPGVMVMDACVRRLFPGRAYDEEGRIAAAGRVVAKVAEQALRDPFFAAPPPKSTGREKFGERYADGLIARCLEAGASPADVVATAVEITALGIGAAAAVLPRDRRPLDVLRSGGGARNPELVAALLRAWPGAEHRAFDEVFFAGEAKEAVAFAFLGYLARTGRAGNEPSATGAVGPRLLGSVTPA